MPQDKHVLKKPTPEQQVQQSNNNNNTNKTKPILVHQKFLENDKQLQNH